MTKITPKHAGNAIIDTSINPLMDGKRKTMDAQTTLQGLRDCVPFIAKTYNMIESSSNDIATWSIDGKSFYIYRPKVFSQDIIPKFFKHNNFSSFVRQLNTYGFRKTKASSFSGKRARQVDGNTMESEYWEFEHDCFHRGNFNLIQTIRRKPPPQTTSNKRSFHTMNYPVEPFFPMDQYCPILPTDTTIMENANIHTITDKVIQLSNELNTLRNSLDFVQLLSQPYPPKKAPCLESNISMDDPLLDFTLF